MTVPSTKCSNVQALKGYLSGFEHSLESKPNGQSKYLFSDDLVLNLYETTGAVVFQGKGAGSPFALQVNQFIEQINNAVPPVPASNV